MSTDGITPHRLPRLPLPQWTAALERAGITGRPVAALDLHAFDANAHDLVRRAGGLPIRVASKSIRVRALLERALTVDGIRGVLSFSLREALWLVGEGLKDVVVAYPSADTEAIAQLARDDRARAEITLMVDEPAHVELIDAAAGPHLPAGETVRVAIELDVSYAPLPGVHLGALRSPITSAAGARSLAVLITRCRSTRLVGMMAYEGHLASVGDAARTPYGALVRGMKKLSAADIAARRAETAAALREVAPLEFVNGGGTGSIETTGAEEAVTEIAAGSGLIGPGLFDDFAAFAPLHALHLGFAVVRRPARNVATLHGGGWVASGAAAADRLPRIEHPTGLAYAPQEGAGEVQTPVIGDAAEDLRVGDTVWLRHAKAGEPAEHVNEYVLLEGSGVVSSALTYRGEGHSFL